MDDRNLLKQEITEEAYSFASAIYRVTEQLPLDEPLRTRLRGFAVDFLTGTAYLHQTKGSFEDPLRFVSLLSALASIESGIVFAGKVGLMKAVNAAVLRHECIGFREYFEQQFFKTGHGLAAGLPSGLPHDSKEHTQGKNHAKNGTTINPSTFPRGIEPRGKDLYDAHSSPRFTLPPNFGGRARDRGVFWEGGGINDNVLSDKIKNDTENVVHVANRGGERQEISFSHFSQKSSRSFDGNTLGRKQKIVQYLNEQGSVRMNDIAGLFGDQFSIKTLQRDLADLISGGQVERTGDKRWAVYRLSAQETHKDFSSV